MADINTLRRRQREADIACRLAEAQPRWKRGRAKARRLYILATADVIRAELNHKIAAPILRARKAQAPTADLFSQIGA